MTDSEKKEAAMGVGGPKGGAGPREPLWTIEKVKTLTDTDVKTLKANAERRDNQPIVEMCERVLVERHPPRSAPGSGYLSMTRTVKKKGEEKDSTTSLENLAARRVNRRRSPKISISAHFNNLGAPLKNVRWSWGAIREGSGEVILRVWRDEVREIDGNKYVQLTNMARFGASKHPGFRERLSHLERLQSGSGGFLIFCEAKDPTAFPRKIEKFDENLTRPTNFIEVWGDTWVGIGAGV